MSTKLAAGEDLFLVTSQAGNTLIPKGRHNTVIVSITKVSELTKDAEWNDKTEWIIVKVRDKEGRMLTIKQSKQAYVRLSELSDAQLPLHFGAGDAGKGEQYAVNKKTGKRVPCKADDEHQKGAMAFFERMAHAAGVEEGEKINFGTLVDKPMGIVVDEKDNGFLEAKTFFRVQATAKVK